MNKNLPRMYKYLTSNLIFTKYCISIPVKLKKLSPNVVITLFLSEIIHVPILKFFKDGVSVSIIKQRLLFGF
jgi:hypothetical protein